MTRRTKAARRAAFRRACALPVRYADVSTAAARRFMDAMRTAPAPMFMPTSAEYIIAWVPIVPEWPE